MAGSFSLQSPARVPSDDESIHSPFQLHGGLVDPHPGVYCSCQREALLRICWDDDNPGRRYIRCSKKEMDGPCDTFAWYEGPHDPFIQALLVDLRNEVSTLRRHRAYLRTSTNDAFEIIEKKDREIMDLKKEVASLLPMLGEKEFLEGKISGMEVEKMLMRFFCGIILGITVFAVLGSWLW